MRISDWSSDVCPSDLVGDRNFAVQIDVGEEALVASHQAAGAKGGWKHHGRPKLGGATPRFKQTRWPGRLRASRTKSEERRVGKGCGSKCRSRLSPNNYKQKHRNKQCTQPER